MILDSLCCSENVVNSVDREDDAENSERADDESSHEVDKKDQDNEYNCTYYDRDRQKFDG